MSVVRDPSPIVFFDGVCALCDGFVRFAVRRDRLGVLYFAPLQGETAERARREVDGFPTDVSTLVYVEDGRAHLRSDAVLRALRRLRAPWSWVGVLGRVVPRCLRDAVYRLVARSRYRVFGRYDVCPVPPAEARARFLS